MSNCFTCHLSSIYLTYHLFSIMFLSSIYLYLSSIYPSDLSIYLFLQCRDKTQCGTHAKRDKHRAISLTLCSDFFLVLLRLCTDYRVYMCVHECVNMCACVYVNVCVHECVHVCEYVCECVCVNMCACVCVCMCVCICM